MSEKRGDVVYTPEWVARDMVEHFSPMGRILEPCKGLGVFMKFLPPTTEWCEITLGRDFFAWNDCVDWLVSNPPYSLTRKWFKHSYNVADNLLYLVPLRNIFSGFGFIREIYDFGGIVEIRNYGTGGMLGFPMGNAVGALHVKREYSGEMKISFATNRFPPEGWFPHPTEAGWFHNWKECLTEEQLKARNRDPRR